jgi:hypothetical protein
MISSSWGAISLKNNKTYIKTYLFQKRLLTPINGDKGIVRRISLKK